ncbi:hypothetical protein RI129_008850 [Pyrocoelia pectoralis]|uniref:Uncharacterized protein n=1 Tax=Pyrocoelia pectoralis TaxID=417401 RepID=A0AAN7ZKH2_9COLE
MAYVLWRVVMKKYSRVRLGLHKVPGLPNVTPTGRHAVTYNEESWKSIPEEQGKSEGPSKASENNNIQSEDLSRSSEVRQSKTKRVKNYIKKCKNALGINSSDSSSHKNDDGHDIEKDLEVIINKSEIRELDHVFEKIGDNSRIEENNLSDLSQVANVVNILPGDERCEGESGTETQSPFLSDVQEKVDSKNGDGIDEDQVHRKEVTEVSVLVIKLNEEMDGKIYNFNYKRLWCILTYVIRLQDQVLDNY